MCSSKSKLHHGGANIAQINGRSVLQPTCNQVPNSLKKSSQNQKSPPNKAPPPLPLPTGGAIAIAKNKPCSVSPPISPKLKSPRVPAPKRVNIEPNSLNSSVDKPALTPSKQTSSSAKKSKRSSVVNSGLVKYSSSQIVEAPGSIAAARREQVAVMQEQRKMKIAHYGRSKSAKYSEANKLLHLDSSSPVSIGREEKRCSFITPNSDPIYVAYHDEEWGVPAHDDRLLFELLVLTGAQVGSDWTSILKKRQDFREAFCEFDAQVVAKFTEKNITSLSAQYGIELSQVRGIVDNSIKILEVKKEFGSFDKYLWKFVNEKAISTQYRSCHKMPVKTSKSETISKDMVKRGFRLVGPTVIHSFMQAAGLTNDHLVTCPRHLQCTALASHGRDVAPAL